MPDPYFFFFFGGGGLLKPGTRSRVLAFDTIGSRVPAFDVIAFTDLISFLPLDSDAVYTVIVRVVPLCFISIQLWPFALVILVVPGLPGAYC